MKNDKDYSIARSQLISAFVKKYGFHAANIYGAKEPSVKTYMGKSDNEIPNGSLVCPMTMPMPGEWYLGWYRGMNSYGQHMVESVESHNMIALTSKETFYYVDDMDFCNTPRFHWSNAQYETDLAVKKKYLETNAYSYVVGECRFNDDGSFVVPLRVKFGKVVAEKTYQGLRYVTKKQIKEHMDELVALTDKQ